MPIFISFAGMKLVFCKYHGTGNDFILVDNRKGNIRLTEAQIERLCDRHAGIGADGLMFLTAQPGYDFGMIYFNSDGKEGTMCGNGGRCITAFARSLGLAGNTARFIASDGNHEAEILKDEGHVTWIRLKMADVKAPPPTPPQLLRFHPQVRGDSSFQSEIVNRKSKIVIDTGSPHLVLFLEDLSAIDIVAEGRKLRNDPQFSPNGINVDFVEIRKDHLFVRTYERGVENETLSCGTGVTAAAVAFAGCTPPQAPPRPGSGETSRQSPVTSHLIETPGGRLTVSFRREGERFTDVFLEGPAERVFSGEMEI
jgi:diaminopimelate epimerase